MTAYIIICFRFHLAYVLRSVESCHVDAIAVCSTKYCSLVFGDYYARILLLLYFCIYCSFSF